MINTTILKNPINWVIVILMLLISSVAFELLSKLIDTKLGE